MCISFAASQSGFMYGAKFSLCAKSAMFTCQFEKLKANYDAMSAANCMKCDKYFHCQGNYDAVYKCSNANLAERKAIAKRLSDCRESAQGSSSADSKEDQVANRHGQNGGNCASKYLCAYGCKFNPKKKTCLKVNC